MIEKMEFKTDLKAFEWYNKRFFEFGVFETSEKYNKLMLEWLGVKDKSRKKLLDIGCGGGVFLKEAEKFLDCFGVDFSSVALTQAQENSAASLVIASASALPFKSNFFDYAVCLGSLEHFIDLKKSLSEIKRILKKNGKINIYVPNSDFILFKFNKATAFQPNERLASIEEWKKLLSEYFSVEKIYKYTESPLGRFLPKKYTYSFSFICSNK